ncbi:uncharacterized protein LOC125561232 [Nematostella vectensis]|uniref:uncharacterized protein LOC125561232 n=1 Tax=Nematostella vectensis TaxID=45351 RepID=UPI002077540D|nr:uncharacterized protein LOC125561232 [Nematostella vectensis]XP_048581026.1 uncharacterized protein LOC125561232 [Nematostella vectensis]
MARKSRLVVFLCLLLFLQEFGPAHVAHVPRPKLREEDQDGSDSAEEHHPEHKENSNKEHEKKYQNPSKRGFGGLIKNGIKILKLGNQVLPKLVTVAAISNTVYRAIKGCCHQNPKACSGHKEIERLRGDVERKANKLDEIELEAKNIQEYIESTSDKFAFVLFELNTIVDNAETFAGALTPDVAVALANETRKIKKLVREKDSTGDKLDYYEAQNMYLGKLQAALGLSIPIFGSIIPSIPGMINFAKKRLGIKKTFVLDHSLDNALRKPPPSSPKASALKSWMAKTKTAISKKMDHYREKINTKYGGIKGIFKKVSDGLALVFGYVSTAYGIYNIVKSFEDCDAKERKVLKALEEFKKADATMDEAITNATKSKTILEKAWMELHKGLSEDALIKDLEEVKNVVASVSEKSQDLQDAVEKVQTYIDNVGSASSYQELYNLVQELANGLTSIPFTLSCYTNKVKMADYVLRGCKRGDDSFDALYDMGLSSFDTNAEECKDKVGFTYLEKYSVHKGLEKMAREEGFDTDCVLNSPLRKTQACEYQNEGYNADKIAEMLKLTLEQVKSLTEDCPKRGLTPKDERTVCKMRKRKNDNKTIAEDLELDLELVEAVKCPP